MDDFRKYRSVAMRQYYYRQAHGDDQKAGPAKKVQNRGARRLAKIAFKQEFTRGEFDAHDQSVAALPSSAAEEPFEGSGA